MALQGCVLSFWCGRVESVVVCVVVCAVIGYLGGGGREGGVGGRGVG